MSLVYLNKGEISFESTQSFLLFDFFDWIRSSFYSLLFSYRVGQKTQCINQQKADGPQAYLCACIYFNVVIRRYSNFLQLVFFMNSIIVKTFVKLFLTISTILILFTYSLWTFTISIEYFYDFIFTSDSFETYIEKQFYILPVIIILSITPIWFLKILLSFGNKFFKDISEILKYLHFNISMI